LDDVVPPRGAVAVRVPTVAVVVADDVGEQYVAWLADDHPVERVESASEALALLEREPPVVLLQRDLPDIHGDRLLGMVRERGLDSRVVMLTGVTPGTDFVRLGFDDFLVRPLDRDTLRSTVDEMLLRADYDQQLREFYDLAARKAELEVDSSTDELAVDEEYRRVTSEVRSTRADVDDVLAAFDDLDAYRGLCRELSRGSLSDELNEDVPEA
jgi:DNA-binding response OmpR family regulator